MYFVISMTKKNETTRIFRDTLEQLAHFSMENPGIYGIWNGVSYDGRRNPITTYYLLSTQRIEYGVMEKLWELEKELKDTGKLTGRLMLKTIDPDDIKNDNNLYDCIWRR